MSAAPWAQSQPAAATGREATVVTTRVNQSDGLAGQVLWVLFAIVPMVVAGQATGLGVIDAWWNFALGRLMWTQQHLIVDDPFSFTAAVDGTINQQWLAQLAWAAAYDTFGPPGAFVLRAAAVAT